MDVERAKSVKLELDFVRIGYLRDNKVCWSKYKQKKSTIELKTLRILFVFLF